MSERIMHQTERGTTLKDIQTLDDLKGFTFQRGERANVTVRGNIQYATSHVLLWLTKGSETYRLSNDQFNSLKHEYQCNDPEILALRATIDDYLAHS